MKEILKEPLIHFLLIGGFLFVLYMMVNPLESENEIVIDDPLINELTAKWELKRGRNPSFQELQGLVKHYIEQEVLYQQALALNLDHNDEIVKRRLAQKMEFLSDGLAESLQPTEEMLQAYYEKHQSDYPKPPVYTMKLVYFDKTVRSDAHNDALAAMNTQNPQDSGDKISISQAYEAVNAIGIARDYGRVFTAAIDSLPIGKWSGPVVSGYGLHLVNISKKEPGGFYSFEEVADKVSVNYNYEASQDFKTALTKSLLKNYTIRFDIQNLKLKEELDEKF